MCVLSVIVPVYKVEKYLMKCVDSILAQTLSNYEIILVDDGSPDNCGQICDDYAKKYENVRVIHKKNGGLTSARQTGLRAAQGRYVGFVDSDDWIDPEMFAVLVEQAEKNNADVVCGSFVFEFGDHSVAYKPVVPSGVYEGTRLDQLRADAIYDVDKMEQGIVPSVCTKIFLKSVAMEPFMSRTDNVRFGEDALFTYPTIFKSKCVVVNNELYAYHYRQWSNSMTHKYSESYFSDQHTLYDILRRTASPIMTGAIERAIAYDYVYLYGIGVLMIMGRGNSASYKEKYRLIKEKMYDERFEESLTMVQLEHFPRHMNAKLRLLAAHRPLAFIMRYFMHVAVTRLMRIFKR